MKMHEKYAVLHLIVTKILHFSKKMPLVTNDITTGPSNSTAKLHIGDNHIHHYDHH